MPNIVAYTALLFWPLVCIAIFKKMRFERAVIWSILAGYLVLPPVANFNPPILPSFDKTTIPSVCALVACLFCAKGMRDLLPRFGMARILIVIFVVGAIPTVLANPDPFVFTVLHNSDPIVFPITELPGLRFRDVFSAVGNQLIVLIPFLLARRFLATKAAMNELLFAMVVAGLIYSIPSLLEIRLSPQMNVWIYGFQQHEFAQSIRGNGYRPLVFLQHGLWLAIFVLTALLAAASLARTQDGVLQPKYVLITLYMMALLVLCKSLASLVYGIALVPLVLFTSPKTQIRLAVILAFVAMVYPVLRGGGLIPTETLLFLAEKIDPERMASLAYRFATEDMLLARASEKPWLGWGGWGRNLVYDPDSLELVTIPDGRWIIAFGTYGFLGYVSEFGLISLPIFLLGWQSWRIRSAEFPRHAATIGLIVAINLVDMLMNATLTPLTWMLAGAALGQAEILRARGRPEPAKLSPVIGRIEPRAAGRGEAR